MEGTAERPLGYAGTKPVCSGHARLCTRTRGVNREHTAPTINSPSLEFYEQFANHARRAAPSSRAKPPADSRQVGSFKCVRTYLYPRHCSTVYTSYDGIHELHPVSCREDRMTYQVPGMIQTYTTNKDASCRLEWRLVWLTRPADLGCPFIEVSCGGARGRQPCAAAAIDATEQ